MTIFNIDLSGSTRVNKNKLKHSFLDLTRKDRKDQKKYKKPKFSSIHSFWSLIVIQDTRKHFLKWHQALLRENSLKMRNSYVIMDHCCMKPNVLSWRRTIQIQFSISSIIRVGTKIVSNFDIFKVYFDKFAIAFF